MIPAPLRAAALVLAGLSVLGPDGGRADPDTEADGVFRPHETADAVLNAERQSWDRHLHAALGLPAWIDLAVDHRTRFEFLEGPFRPGEPDTQTQLPQRTRLRLGVDGPGPVRALVELQDARTWGDGRHDFTRGQIDELDVLQLFVSATQRDLLGSGLRGDLHLGRLTLDVGSRRLVARNRTRNTTNAFDGIHLQLGARDLAWRVRAFHTWPVVREPDVFDDGVSSRTRFWGAAYEDARLGWLQFDATYLELDDRDGERELRTLGLRIRRPPRSAQLDYELELIGQLGDLGARDQRAFATHVELGYTCAAPWSPRLVAQFDYATGSDDPADDESQTFVPLFGARRFDLVATGIYGPFARANILSPGIRVLLQPHDQVRAQVKLRHWQLAEARDAFVGTGLQDATGQAGRNLGTDLELRVQWDPKGWLGFDAGYAHWFKGSYLDRVPAVSSTRDADYVYLATRLRF